MLERTLQTINVVAAIAVAEFRNAWRSARGRLFGGAVVVFIAWLFGGYMHWHADNPVPYLASAYSLPRFLIAQFGTSILAVSLVGLLFVLFDAGHRDQRAGIADVLDARPASNTARLWGLLAAGVAVVWLPAAAGLGVAQGFGALARATDWWMGDTIEPISLVAFLFVDLLPALTAWGAVVLALASCLRGRSAVLLSAAALLGALGWLAANIPVHLHDALLPFAAPVGFASDLAPRFGDGFALAQRAATLAAAFGLMVLTARFAPRLDDHVARRRAALRGSAAAIAGAVALALAVAWKAHGLELRANWLRVHQDAAKAGEAVVDIQRLAAEIAIAPGERLAIDVEIALTAAGDAPIRQLVFSFNPGMGISVLRMDGMAGFDHQHGLLTIRLTDPLLPGANRTLALQAEGEPDARFAYLDGAVDPLRVNARNRIWQLGREASLFEETYVALMPGALWLPMPGANIEREDARRDFFGVDLTVAVPPGWLVAGPGRRRPTADGFAFRPGAPVREVALFAAPFAQRALAVDGVRVEVLAAPAHMGNLARLVGDGAELARQVRELFADARQAGLPYPYAGLSLVEVPARLRVYRGGAHLRSALELPGVLAVREPIATVRFEKRLAMFASGPAEGRMQLLKEFLRTDHHGGDLYRAFTFSLFGAVTGARGPAAATLDALCRDLAYLLVVIPPRFAYHALPEEALAHSFHADAPPAALVVNLANQALGGRWASFGAQSRRPDRPDVWEYALGGDAVALSADPRAAERAAYATALRASRTANAITELLGRERTAALLARLRRRFAGGAFEAADLGDAGDDRAVLTIVEHWLTRQSLPGFAVSEATVTPAVDGNGHHVRLHLRNETAAPGVAFVSTHEFPWLADSVRTRALLIEPNSAVELGMRTPDAPSQLWLHSYLSLHRKPRLVPAVMLRRGTANAEAFLGARPSTWRPPPVRGIVVDDLSAGFSVQGAAERQGLFARFAPPPLLDAGLPASPVEPGRWQRMSAPTAAGRYRRTVARAWPARRGQNALFRAELPVAGRWRLDYHLPPQHGRPDAWGGLAYLGSFALRLRAGAVDQVIAFDGRAATGGWNRLGEYDLPAGPATLVVGTGTNGRVVVADAIRWQVVDPHTR